MAFGSTAENNKDRPGQNFQTIAVMRISDTSYLIRKDDKGKVVFQAVYPATQKSFYQNETRSLPREAFVSFEGVEANKVTIANIGLVPISVRWIERASGVEEPIISIPVTDAIQGAESKIEMSSRELQDLFLEEHPGGKEDVAAFFTIPTLQEDMIFILLRRPYPVILNIAPRNDGIDMSPVAGLQNFISSLAPNLVRTQLQTTVDNRINIALQAENTPIKFKTSSDTPSGIRQREIQKTIYKIEASLMALNAEASGAGLKDQALVTLAPFITDIDEKRINGSSSTGLSLFGKVFARGEISFNFTFARGHEVTIDNSIWTSLLAKPGTGFLLGNQKPETTSRPPASPRPARPPVSLEELMRPSETPPASRPRPAEVQPPRRVEARQSPTLPVVARSENNEAKQKQEAINLSRPIETALQELGHLFDQLELSEVRTAKVKIFNERLKTVTEAIQKYTSARETGRRVQNPTITLASPTSCDYKVAGINYDKIFGFLTGERPLDYREKIRVALSAWDSVVAPLTVMTSSFKERSLGTMKKKSQGRAQAGGMSGKIVDALESLMDTADRIMPIEDNIDVVTVTHVLLVTQILGALQGRYTDLKQKAKSEEVDSFADYALEVIGKIKELNEQI